MIFLKRFTVLDISMTAYAGFDEAHGTNAGLSMDVNLMLTRRYYQLVILIQETNNDDMHLGFWNIDPICIIITRVTLSSHIIYIYYIISYLFFIFGGLHLTLHPLSIWSTPRQKYVKKIYQYSERDIGL